MFIHVSLSSKCKRCAGYDAECHKCFPDYYAGRMRMPDWVSGQLRSLIHSEAPEHILSMQLHSFCLDKRQRLFHEELI